MSSKLQAIIFNKNNWTVIEAKNYIKLNNFKPLKNPHITNNFIRFRLVDPKEFKHFITKSDKSGIEYIIGFY